MRLRETERKRTGFSPALGLLLLSALWAIAWMRSDLFPQLGADVLSTAQSQAALFSIFAVVAASIAFVRGIEFPRGHSAWAPAGIGVGLFVIPTGLVACAHGWVSNLDQIAVFSLTPILAVVLEPYLQDNDLRQGEGALMSALIAITGILCLFPLDLPNSLRAGLAWCALLASVFSIAATNCLAVNLARSLPERSTVPIAAQAAAASALCFAAAALFAPRVPWRLSVLLPPTSLGASDRPACPVLALLADAPSRGIQNDRSLSSCSLIRYSRRNGPGSNPSTHTGASRNRPAGRRRGMASLRARENIGRAKTGLADCLVR